MKYTAAVMHNDEMSRKKHEDMGVLDGWGTVLEQLVQYVTSVRLLP